MEEKKLNSNATIKAMKGKKENVQENQKLTYEQLNNACMELYQQNQNLIKQVQQLNMNNAFTRLNFLFKVLENAHVIKDTEFINLCVEEIKDAMIVPKEEDDSKEK